MILRGLSILFSLLLLLNSIAIDFVTIFAPTKAEVLKEIRENHEGQKLEYPCQFDSCGCTKETCLTDCCCKSNHEVFKGLKESQACHQSEVALIPTSEKFIDPPQSVVRKMICKQNKLKENDQILLKRDLFIAIKQDHIRFILNKRIIIKLEPNLYIGIKTQTVYSPDSPPPNIS